LGAFAAIYQFYLDYEAFAYAGWSKNGTISMLISEKIKALRTAEELSQSQFCKIIEIPVSTLKNLEGNHCEPTWSTLTKIIQNQRFKKYTLWLMNGETAPSAGQIAPALAHSGTDGGEAQKRTRKTGEDSDVKSSRYAQKTG